MTRRGVFRCSLAAVLFGISAPAASRLAGDMGAFTLAGLLYLGAAIAVLPVIGRIRPTRRAVVSGAPRLATAVVFGGAIGPVLLAAGLSRTPAATASLLLNLELVFTTVLAYFFFKEHVGPRVAAGTALVVVAGAVLGWSGDPDLRWGVLLIAGACLCWAVDNCVTASLDELAPSHITFVKGVIAGSANLLIGLVIGGSSAGWPIIAALVVGGFGYGMSITLWVAGARDLGAARGQLVLRPRRLWARSWRGPCLQTRRRLANWCPWSSPWSASASCSAATTNTVTSTRQSITITSTFMVMDTTTIATPTGHHRGTSTPTPMR